MSFRFFSVFLRQVGIISFVFLTLSACAAPKGPLAKELDSAEVEPQRSAGRLQLEVMDFSDQYVSAMWAAMDEYIQSEPDPAKRVLAQNWKVTFGSSAMQIAASNDPRLNLLDMVVFISAGKWAVNKYWVPDVFGLRAARLARVYERMDKDAWAMADRILTKEQMRDLRNLIAAWKAQNPAVYEVGDLRLRNLEGVQLEDFDNSNTAKGLLASVRKLLSRVDTSLLYGERVMFYLGRTPRILTQQTDLTLSQIAEAFPIATIQPNYEKIAGTFQSLPQMLQDGIDRNQGLVREIVPEIRATVESADRLGQTLEGTLTSLTELSDSLRESMASMESPVETVRAADSALNHLDSTVSGLNLLLLKDETGESRVTELTKLLNSQTEQLVNVAFQKALILMAVFFAGVIVTLFVARNLFCRRK